LANRLCVRARLILPKPKKRFGEGMKCGDRLRGIGCFDYSFQFGQGIVVSFSGDEAPETVNGRGALHEQSLACFGICASAQVPHQRLVV